MTRYGKFSTVNGRVMTLASVATAISFAKKMMGIRGALGYTHSFISNLALSLRMRNVIYMQEEDGVFDSPVKRLDNARSALRSRQSLESAIRSRARSGLTGTIGLVWTSA